MAAGGGSLTGGSQGGGSLTGGSPFFPGIMVMDLI